MKKGCCTGAKVACLLLTVGALNWGLVGLGGWIGDNNWNVVNLLLGNWEWLENLVYVLVGVAGVMKLMGGCKCKKCKGGSCAAPKADA